MEIHFTTAFDAVLTFDTSKLLLYLVTGFLSLPTSLIRRYGIWCAVVRCASRTSSKSLEVWVLFVIYPKILEARVIINLPTKPQDAVPAHKLRKSSDDSTNETSQAAITGARFLFAGLGTLRCCRVITGFAACYWSVPHYIGYPVAARMRSIFVKDHVALLLMANKSV